MGLCCCTKILEALLCTVHILVQGEDDPLNNLDVAQLDITSQEDYILDEAAGNIHMKIIAYYT